jgi:hypothetical protein
MWKEALKSLAKVIAMTFENRSLNTPQRAFY